MLFPQKIKVVAHARHINPHREVVVVQNDTAVEFLVAVIGDNGQTNLPSETSYVLTSLHVRKRPTQKLGVMQEDGNILFDLDQAELGKTGTVQAYIQAYHPEKGRVTSHPFTYHVAPDPLYGAEIRPPDKSLIEQVIGEGPAIIAEAKRETELNITERARLTGAVGGALSSLADDKAQALLEMSQSKDAADQSAQVAQQAADNADDERERLTLDVSAKLNEVETARSATVDATGEATEAAGLARDEADAARLQKEEVQQILGAGPVASVNGETGVVTGLATQESVNQVTAQLAEKANKDELQAVASGAPKPYVSLEAIQAAFPNGDSNHYLNATDGYWYYWNGTDWTKGGVYLSSGLQIFQHSPINPTIGQMWITQSFWEGIFQYNFHGVPGEILDVGKVKILDRGQSGQASKPYATFAKISEDGFSGNLSYDPNVTGVNIGDTSVFPLLEPIDLDLYEYRVNFDMSIAGPNKTTETLGVALQSDEDSTALIDQENSLQIRTAHVSSTENFLQVVQVMNGTQTILDSITVLKADYANILSAIEVLVSKDSVTVFVDGVKKTSVEGSFLPHSGSKISLFTQNRTRIISSHATDNKVANLILERFGV